MSLQTAWDMRAPAIPETFDTSSAAHHTESTVYMFRLQSAPTRATAIRESIRQLFRGIVYGEWSCSHDKLGLDEIGDLYCKRCNADLME